jgi:hypothetical protein
METMNRAFIMKLAWGMLHGNSLLVRFLKAKYIKFIVETNNRKAMNKDFVLWKAICQVWPRVFQSLSWTLGNGKKVLFWKDD